MSDRPAELVLDGYAGTSRQRVAVVGETPKRYRIRATHGPVKLSGRYRWLMGHNTALVPKSAIRFTSTGQGK